MEDITKVTITATAPEDAEYLYDLIVAQRVAANLAPVRFNFARILRLRVPTLGATVFVLPEPLAGLEGIKILSEEQEKDTSGTRLDNETLLGKYVYASANPATLEVIQTY